MRKHQISFDFYAETFAEAEERTITRCLEYFGNLARFNYTTYAVPGVILKNGEVAIYTVDVCAWLEE